MTLAILAYLALIWALHRDARSFCVADALAINWGLNQAVVMLNGNYPVLPLFIAIDLACGAWLALYCGSRMSRNCATFFIPMIALNAAVYANGSQPPYWHYVVLFGLAWAQALTVALGAWGDGLRQYLDTATCRIRVSLARAANFFKGGRP